MSILSFTCVYEFLNIILLYTTDKTRVTGNIYISGCRCNERIKNRKQNRRLICKCRCDERLTLTLELDNILVKVVELCINVNIDGTPIPCRLHTGPSLSQGCFTEGTVVR